MIEGSGGSEEYDEEDISDESGMLRQQYIAQQMAAAKAAQQQQQKRGPPPGFGGAGEKPAFLGGGAGGLGAGGMGAGALVFLNAKLQSGINLVKEMVGFEEKIKNANWIITGEGKLDSQTLSGKTIDGVITSAKKQNIPVAALCGSISLSKTEADALGLSYTDAVMEKAKSLEDAMQNGYDYVKQLAINFARTID